MATYVVERRTLVHAPGSRYGFASVAAVTEVTWRMQGEQAGLMGVVGRVVPRTG